MEEKNSSQVENDLSKENTGPNKEVNANEELDKAAEINQERSNIELHSEPSTELLKKIKKQVEVCVIMTNIKVLTQKYIVLFCYSFILEMSICNEINFS